MLLLSKAYRWHSRIRLTQARNGEKNGPNKFIPALLRHITQIEIDIIINVSFKYRNVKYMERGW